MTSHSSLWRTFRVATTAVIVLTLSACGTTPPGPKLVKLPALDPSAAATLNVRSKTNPSPIKHYHLLSLDGQKIARMDESDRDRFLIAPGTHTLDLTCHTRNTAISDGFPVNYNVSDGSDSMEIDVQAGDTLCINVAFKLFNCAVLDEADPSYCN